MDMLRSVLGAGPSGSGPPAGTASSADTIERLVDRLSHSSLLEDRRDACRAIKAMSRKFRVEVGVQSLEAMTEVLFNDFGGDDELVGYALDTLCNICSPDEFEEEVGNESAKDNNSGIGEQFTEILLKDKHSVQIVVDVLQEFDFTVGVSRVPMSDAVIHL